MAQEFGNKVDDTQRTKGTDTIFFIPPSKVPFDRNVTYIQKVYTYRPEKAEPNQTQIIAMDNFITNYSRIRTNQNTLEVYFLYKNS